MASGRGLRSEDVDVEDVSTDRASTPARCRAIARYGGVEFAAQYVCDGHACGGGHGYFLLETRQHSDAGAG
jgi:hypothetical protein